MSFVEGEGGKLAPSDSNFHEMTLIYNKIGRVAYRAVKTKNLRAIHINKDKIKKTRFHEILLKELRLELTDEELSLLDEKYAIPKTAKGINFDHFARDFKRIGKALFDRYLKNKVMWRKTTRKINLMGGLPDNGVVLEDLSSTLRAPVPIVDKFLDGTIISNPSHISKYKGGLINSTASSVVLADHPATFGTPKTKTITAKAAAYSSVYAVDGLMSSEETEVTLHDLNKALSVAEEIDTLRGRVPPRRVREAMTMTPGTKKETIRMISSMTGHSDGRAILNARARKQGLALLQEVKHSDERGMMGEGRGEKREGRGESSHKRFLSLQGPLESQSPWVYDPLSSVQSKCDTQQVKHNSGEMREKMDRRRNEYGSTVDVNVITTSPRSKGRLLPPLQEDPMSYEKDEVSVSPRSSLLSLEQSQVGERREAKETQHPQSLDSIKAMSREIQRVETTQEKTEMCEYDEDINDEEREEKRAEREEILVAITLSPFEKAKAQMNRGEYSQAVEQLVNLLEIREFNATCKKEADKKEVRNSLQR